MIYCGEKQEKIFKEFQTSRNQDRRGRIYQKIIRPIFKKIVLGVWWSQFRYNEKADRVPTHVAKVFREECLDNLVLTLNKTKLWDESKGRAFSYYTKIARNFFLLKIKKFYKQKEKCCNLLALPEETVRVDCEEYDCLYEKKEKAFERLDRTFKLMMKKKYDGKKDYNYDKKLKLLILIKNALRDKKEIEFKKDFVKELSKQTGLETKQINQVISAYLATKKLDNQTKL